MIRKKSPHLEFAHQLWKNFLTFEDIAIDATVGNGHDTLYLSSLVQYVFGLDIQEKALESAMKKVQGAPVKLFLKSHTEIQSLPLPSPPKLIVFNLGYLPGADKWITTKWETTLFSAKASLELLAPNGALSITCYPHEEGVKEEMALLDWAQKLDSTRWSVSHYTWGAGHPTLLWIFGLHS